MMILCPEGWGVNLNYAVSVSTVTRRIGNSGKCDAIVFHINMSNQYTEDFIYALALYADDEESLINKVNNIRNIILKTINNGSQPKEILGNIILKK